MAQKYKVFINDKVVFFHIEAFNANNYPEDCVLVSDNKTEIEEFIFSNQMNDKDLHVFGLQSYSNYFKDYEKINAAGGLVINSKNEYLFIYRHDKWDLPKGKVELGENLDEAALREVEEECGFSDLILREHLITTLHTYEMFGKKVLKPTYWYKMYSDFKGEFTPQIEEDITKVEWKNKNDLEEVKSNTYGSILDVLEVTSFQH